MTRVRQASLEAQWRNGNGLHHLEVLSSQHVARLCRCSNRAWGKMICCIVLESDTAQSSHGFVKALSLESLTKPTSASFLVKFQMLRKLVGQVRRRPPAQTGRFHHATCCATDSHEAVRLQNVSAHERLADEQQPLVWNLRRATLLMSSPLESGAMPLVHGQPICSGNR